MQLIQAVDVVGSVTPLSLHWVTTLGESLDASCPSRKVTASGYSGVLLVRTGISKCRVDAMNRSPGIPRPQSTNHADFPPNS